VLEDGEIAIEEVSVAVVDGSERGVLEEEEVLDVAMEEISVVVSVLLSEDDVLDEDGVGGDDDAGFVILK